MIGWWQLTLRWRPNGDIRGSLRLLGLPALDSPASSAISTSNKQVRCGAVRGLRLCGGRRRRAACACRSRSLGSVAVPGPAGRCLVFMASLCFHAGRTYTGVTKSPLLVCCLPMLCHACTPGHGPQGAFAIDLVLIVLVAGYIVMAGMDVAVEVRARRREQQLRRQQQEADAAAEERAATGRRHVQARASALPWSQSHAGSDWTAVHDAPWSSTQWQAHLEDDGDGVAAAPSHAEEAGAAGAAGGGKARPVAESNEEELESADTVRVFSAVSVVDPSMVSLTPCARSDPSRAPSATPPHEALGASPGCGPAAPGPHAHGRRLSALSVLSINSDEGGAGHHEGEGEGGSRSVSRRASTSMQGPGSARMAGSLRQQYGPLGAGSAVGMASSRMQQREAGAAAPLPAPRGNKPLFRAVQELLVAGAMVACVVLWRVYAAKAADSAQALSTRCAGRAGGDCR